MSAIADVPREEGVVFRGRSEDTADELNKRVQSFKAGCSKMQITS